MNTLVKMLNRSRVMLTCWTVGLVVCILPVLSRACRWGRYDECPSWPSCSRSCGGGERCRICESCFWHIDKRICELCNPFCYNGGNFLNGQCICPVWRTGACCETCIHISMDHCLHEKQECGGSPDGIGCTQCEIGFTPGGYGKGCLDNTKTTNVTGLATTPVGSDTNAIGDDSGAFEGIWALVLAIIFGVGLLIGSIVLIIKRKYVVSLCTKKNDVSPKVCLTDKP